MSVESTIATMKLLKLHGMAQSIAELSAQASPAYSKAEPILQQLLKAEVAEREVRSIQYQMKVARFPAYRDLTGFDFMQSEVNEELITALHHCEFMEEAQNVVFIGGPGTGKTHLATAIAVQAIQHHHKRIRFLSTIELVNPVFVKIVDRFSYAISCCLAPLFSTGLSGFNITTSGLDQSRVCPLQRSGLSAFACA